MSRASHSHRVDQGYTLGTLFLLIAACASVLALVTPLVRSHVGEEIGLSEFAISVICGGLSFGAIGLLVGLFHFSRLHGSLLGLLLGITLGTFAGPLVFVPIEELAWLLLIAVGGCALVLGLAVANRVGSHGWHKAGSRVESRKMVEAPRHPLDPDPEE